VKEIPLSQGKVATIDDADYEKVSAFKWHARKSQSGVWYAIRTFRIDGKDKHVPMQRFLVETGPKEEVDHIDRNGLNNRRENLRRCTKRQNSQNRKRRKRGTKSSRYHGVNYDPKTRRWNVVICAGELNVKGHAKQIYIGRFRSEKDAARAYDKAAIKYFGEFALTNFPKAEYVGKSLEIIRPKRVGMKGSKNPRAKLTEAKVLRIRRLVAAGHPQAPLATHYHVDPALIERIIHRKIWKHI
jgi:hypothetical protein